MALSHPKSFYASDARFQQFEIGGINYNNTDGGVLYYAISVVGSTLTLNLYKNDKRHSSALVATGTGTSSTTNYTDISLAASNSSGLTFNGCVFDDSEQSRDSLTGKILVAFTVDSDLDVYEKTLENLAPDNAFEGQGDSGNRFIRLHRETTRHMIQALRRKVKEVVGCDDRNMPDLFQVLDFEAAKKAAVFYCLSLLFQNTGNMVDVTVDPSWQRSKSYMRDYEAAFARIDLYLDRDLDKRADGMKGGGYTIWR